jgi:rod shape-determining protein MreC
MAFGAGTYRTAPVRVPAPGFRFTLYAILAILLMFFDQRRGWLEQARYFLTWAAYPLQLAVSSPTAAWYWLEDYTRTREQLRSDNAQLRQHERALEMQTLRYEALARENGELRGLRDALPAVADHWLVAEVVDVELNNLQQRVLINRGAHNGVFKGQAVMDSHGLLGQTVHVGPFSAEVILVTDPEHAVPVQIERTGVRTIAVGTGESEIMALPYLPANADVKVGDLLITSGLGGVFPQGYPVAKVAEVRRDAVQPLAQIRADPLARLDQLREVMLVWFRADHPASPSGHTGTSNATGSSSAMADLKNGNVAFQPQLTPPPKPPPEAAPAAGISTASPSSAAPAPVPRAPVPPAPASPAAPAAAHAATPAAIPSATPQASPGSPAPHTEAPTPSAATTPPATEVSQ